MDQGFTSDGVLGGWVLGAGVLGAGNAFHNSMINSDSNSGIGYHLI